MQQIDIQLFASPFIQLAYIFEASDDVSEQKFKSEL